MSSYCQRCSKEVCGCPTSTIAVSIPQVAVQITLAQVLNSLESMTSFIRYQRYHNEKPTTEFTAGDIKRMRACIRLVESVLKEAKP